MRLLVSIMGALAGGVLAEVAPPSLDAVSAWRVALTAIVVAIGSLGVVTAGQLAAVQSTWRRLGLHLPARRSTDVAAAPIVGQAVAAGGGPGPRAPVVPLPVPAWSQRNDPNPDGSQDPYWYEDCGEQCVSIVTYACRGVEVPQGVVRVQMHGLGGRGLSSGADLARQLERWHFSVIRQQLSAEATLAYLRQAVAARRSPCVLGHWLSPTLLHWVVVVEITPDGVTFQDPWYGTRRGLSLAHWSDLYAGDLVDPGEPVRY